MSVLPISAIKVGDRSRKDFGDIAGLAESIRTLGLLNPVVVDTNHNLVAGDRRIAAFKSLGLSEIPATVIATLDDARLALAAERDENTCRKEMTPEELFDMAERIRTAVEADAKLRQDNGRVMGGEIRSGKRDSALSSADDKAEKDPAWKNRTSSKLAETVGMSDATYRRTQSVVLAARDESNPEVQAIAKEALADLNAGKLGAAGAASRVTKARKKATTPQEPETQQSATEKPQAPPKYGSNRRKPAQIIAASITSAQGLCLVLDEIETLGGQITEEEAGRYTSDLSTIIRSLKRIQSLLKES